MHDVSQVRQKHAEGKPLQVAASFRIVEDISASESPPPASRLTPKEILHGNRTDGNGNSEPFRDHACVAAAVTEGPSYVPLDRPVRLTEHNWPAETQPVVSICCITYNHAPFIRDAIEGFLMQETTFPVEILIHDDASTDNTQRIIQEYEEKHPHLFKPVYQSVNQYSQGYRPGQKTRERAIGEYIAVCEGDDYWTDPRKLQIQVDFLDCNPEYVVSGHDAYIIDDAGNRVSESKMPQCRMGNYSGDDLIMGRAWLLTMSLVYRNVLAKAPPEMRQVRNGDVFLLSVLGQYGKSKYHQEIKPAVYRRHPGGVWSHLSATEKRDSHINTYFWLYRYYQRNQNPVASKHYWNRMALVVIQEATALQLVKLLMGRMTGQFRLPVFLVRALARDFIKRAIALVISRSRH